MGSFDSKWNSSIFFTVAFEMCGFEIENLNRGKPIQFYSKLPTGEISLLKVGFTWLRVLSTIVSRHALENTSLTKLELTAISILASRNIKGRIFSIMSNSFSIFVKYQSYSKQDRTFFRSTVPTNLGHVVFNYGTCNLYSWFFFLPNVYRILIVFFFLLIFDIAWFDIEGKKKRIYHYEK